MLNRKILLGLTLSVHAVNGGWEWRVRTDCNGATVADSEGSTYATQQEAVAAGRVAYDAYRSEAYAMKREMAQ